MQDSVENKSEKVNRGNATPPNQRADSDIIGKRS